MRQIGITAQVLLVTMLALVACWAADAHRSHQAKTDCAMRLQRFSDALWQYTKSNDGVFPSTIDDLVESGLLSPADLICPADSVVHASEWPEALDSPLTCSFAYVGAGIQAASEPDPDIVVAIERTGHHGSGTHLLFATGEVRFVVIGREGSAEEAAFSTMIARAGCLESPVRWPAQDTAR